MTAIKIKWHKLKAMEITISMPNNPMVLIEIYWSAALLQHIFLKSVTCQAHSRHAELFSSSVNGTGNLQCRGHMRPASTPLSDYFILYHRLKLHVMDTVRSRCHTLEVLQDILHSRPFTTLIPSIAFKESEGSSLFECFRLFLREHHRIRHKQGKWNQEL